MVGFEAILAPLGYLAGAVLSAGSGLWVWHNGDRERPDRLALIATCVLTALWCALSVAFDPQAPAVILAETARNLAMIAVIFRLFAADGRDESLRPIRPVIIALALVQMFQPVLLFIDAQTRGFVQIELLVFEVGTVLNMLVAIGALVLLHNLYAGAAASSRQIIRWSGFALAGIFAYDLNYYTIAYLSQELPGFLVTLRGAVAGVMAVILAVGANATSAKLQFRPSRAVTFQTLSLMVIFFYLAAMVLVTRGLAVVGGDIARAGQVVFLVLAVVAAMVWLPSERARGWLRVTATKHLFQHRYDYREEWLRFTRTISSSASAARSVAS